MQIPYLHCGSGGRRVRIKADSGDGFDLSRYASDRAARRNVERMIENVVNSLSDMGKIILAQAETEMPESYRASSKNSVRWA